MKSQKSIKRQEAYTLIEILIALFIFAIISAIVLMTLQTMTNARARLQESADTLAEVQKAVTLLSRDIEQIINRQIRTETGRREAAVLAAGSGANASLTMTRAGRKNPNAINKVSALQRVRYRLEDGALVRETWNELDRDSGELPNKQILIQKMNKLSWRYVDANNKSFDLWPPVGRRTGPPRAIEFTLDVDGFTGVRRLVLLPQHIEQAILTIENDSEEAEESS